MRRPRMVTMATPGHPARLQTIRDDLAIVTRRSAGDARCSNVDGRAGRAFDAPWRWSKHRAEMARMLREHSGADDWACQPWVFTAVPGCRVDAA
jgi:hypothetical protein